MIYPAGVERCKMAGELPGRITTVFILGALVQNNRFCWILQIEQMNSRM
jgi:hypothetical protein